MTAERRTDSKNYRAEGSDGPDALVIAENQERQAQMEVESLTVKGWLAVPVFLAQLVTSALTALATALPITWLVNRVFSPTLLHAVFANDQLGYWQCVGMFAIWYAAKGRIKWRVKS